MPISHVENIDCMEFMKTLPDKAMDLAIVDPPYGLDKDSLNGRGQMKNRAIVKDTSWDIAPNQDYWKELFRISQNQIIWGGNYFALPATRCVICWDKMQPWENFSQWEMAWTSFYKPCPIFKFDNRTGGKIHPTQKPIELYKWLLKNYAKEGDKILDTHGGSMSSVIAALDMGFEIHCCELDTEYYLAAKKRIESFLLQTNAFQETPEIIFK